MSGILETAADDGTKDGEYPKQFMPDSDNNSAGFVQPNQVNSGVGRGTQRFVNSDGSYVTIGQIPGTTNEFGIAFFDRSNNMISKNNGSTQYVYDITTGKNIIQMGKLPDGTYGLVVAKVGYNVSEIFT